MAASVVNGGEGGVKGKLFPLMAECLHYYPFWEASLGEFAPGFGGTSLLSSSPESNPSKPSAPSEHLGGMTTMTPWGLPPTTIPLKHRRVPWKDVNSRKNEQWFFVCLFVCFFKAGSSTLTLWAWLPSVFLLFKGAGCYERRQRSLSTRLVPTSSPNSWVS